MGLFDNVKRQAKIAGNSLASAASATYNNAAVARQAQDEINTIRREIDVIQTELDNAYIQIGRKYVEYIQQTNEIPEIGAGSILTIVDTKLTRKEELTAQLIEKQKRINDQFDMQEKAQLEALFAAEKENLDRALAMAVINQEEYDAKLKQLRGRIDHFDEIKRINQQKEMGLITAAEKEAKINALLS